MTMSSRTLSTLDTQSTSQSQAAVIDHYHGVQVADAFRWLEDGDEPAVKSWTVAQNRTTRAHLDSIDDRAAIHARLTELFDNVTPSFSALVARPGRFFGFKFQPPKQQRLLVTLDSVDDLTTERVVLDPNQLVPAGQVAIDWFVPSPDGSQVAVCLSVDGSEEGSLHFFDTLTGWPMADQISRVQCPTGGGSVAWAPDGKSVFYTRYPRAGERPASDLSFYQQIFRHHLGTSDADDEYSVGRDFPRIALIELATSRDGQWIMAQVANGDGGEYAHYLLDVSAGCKPVWRQVTHFEDAVKRVAFGSDGKTLYLRSVNGAPCGQILRLPIDGSVPLADAVVVVPEGDAVIESFVVTPSHLYVAELVGGPSQVRCWDLASGSARVLPIPGGLGVANLMALDQRDDDERVLYRQSGFTEPDAWYQYDPGACDGAGEVRKTALVNSSPADFSDIEVLREFAASVDGTLIPVSILRRKGTPLDGNNPTLLYAYGGYGHSLRPQFNPMLRLWFDRGGVYVVANIRGGGEFGERWHLEGNLTCKQNVFDDFAGCARHLIERGYTCSSRLAVEGRSNGGLLMGAFLTQHPQLARAVVAHVGMYDMLRVELDPNGAFNVTEFGTVNDPVQFQALHSYSPYHKVADGTHYPSIFFLAGEKDGRVNPSHSRKMVARLQDANASENPILIRLTSDSGHGMGTALAERIAESADVIAFLYDQLVMPAH